MTRLALLMDLDRCTGCQSCVAACKDEMQTSSGAHLIRLTQIGPEGRFPHLTMYYLPVTCQQCTEPACADSCPERAISRDEDGVMVVDAGKCNGCGECVAACPYGAIIIDDATGLARKCDLCAGLRLAGRRPACVAACPAKAIRVIGQEAEQPESVPEIGRRGPVEMRVLRPSAGTGPSGRFILTCQPWQDGT